MFEVTSEDLFLPSCHDEELVDNLLCCEDSKDCSTGSNLSLSKALLPLVDSSSPPDVPWMCSTRYKTELCTSYSTSGSCRYAERCQFAHGLHELLVPFRHPKYKTALCRSYHTTGYCYYGNRCLFVHNPSEQRQVHHRRRNVPCRTFSSFRVCPFGTRCNFLHVEDGEAGSGVSAGSEKPNCSQVRAQPREWKPRGALCHTFSSFGFCLYGTRCRFQHGLPSKMRGPEQLSPSSSGFSSNGSTSSSPPSASPVATPSPEALVHNAFTFSSQHLSDLLLPLALHLQQLEGAKTPEVWDSRAL
ncbi:cysteine three histidine 1 [Kryptolebias marmoratus]|uniref:mRNA decay activator protein ZFP36 n=1 Tax=Kryptolebias marmoratus TaxID=37003 RepID=A0A3Q2ZX54_KRYMA|nr:cysteine three histidine 1 [Kryptolebias marmoratus]